MFNYQKIDQYDKNGVTPLIMAIFRGEYDDVKLLLGKGCDPNKKDVSGNSPLWYAKIDFEFFDIAELLEKYGAKI